MLADSKRAYILSAFICCFVAVQVKNYVKIYVCPWFVRHNVVYLHSVNEKP